MNMRASPGEQLPVFDNEQAWYGPDMEARTDWIHTLTESDLADLDQALQHAQQAVTDLVKMRAQDFPLTTLATTLKGLQRDLLYGRGFFLIRGVPVERYSRRDSALVFMGIGHYLGEPVSQNGKGHILGHVKDLGRDFNDPETRGYQTSADLYFHTDYSDVVGLLCLKTSKSGGQSALVSSTTLWNEMVRRRPDLALELTRPICYTRWGEIPEGKKRYAEVPPFTPWKGRLIGFINVRQTIMKAQRFPEVPRLTEKQIEALDFMDALAADPSIHMRMEFRPGDIQMVCNHSILHARTAYQDWPELEKRRHLMRLWLACDQGAELPPFLTVDFQGKTAGGRPNGINVPGVPFTAPLEAE